MTQEAPFIDRLFVYPVKGLAGLERSEAAITPFGLEGDRRYMLIDPAGRFMTQRLTPELTQFQVQALGPEQVTISMAGHGTLALPLDDGVATSSMGETQRVQIWDDVLQAAVGNDEADAFFSDALGRSVRLAWMPPNAEREADPAFAARGERVSFADGFPILVLGNASIAELNERLEIPVPANRFRANVLIGGSQPWIEDQWKTIRTEDATLDLVKPCARCVVITTDQESGERSKEPTATLSTYRVREGKVMVGVNAVAHPEGGVLRSGQRIDAA